MFHSHSDRLLQKQHIKQHQKQQGIYLLLHRTRLLVHRTLFLRLSYILQSPQIPLPLVHTSLKALGDYDMDVDEIECVLSNLIYKGVVRGYISHEKRTLVLSKKEGFPRAALQKL